MLEAYFYSIMAIGCTECEIQWNMSTTTSKYGIYVSVPVEWLNFI